MATKKRTKKVEVVERIRLGIKDFYFQDTTSKEEQENYGLPICFYGYWKPVTEASISALQSKGRTFLKDGELGDFLHAWNKEIA